MPESGAWIRPAVDLGADPFAPTKPGRAPVTLISTVLGGAGPRGYVRGIARLAVSADGGTFAHVASDGSIDVWRRGGAQVEATE